MNVVDGRRDRRHADRARPGRVRGGQRLPPRRPDDRRHGQPLARSPPGRPTSAAPGSCSRRCRRHEIARVVVAASDKAYGAHDELPYREDFALQPRFPYDVSKAATDLIARSYWHTYGLPGGHHAPREHLRRRRHQPLAADPRGRGRRARGPAAGDPLRRHPRARLPLRRRRRGGVPGAWPARSTATARAGEAFNAGGGRPHAVLEVVELICRLAGTDVEPDIRGTGTPRGRDRPPVRGHHEAPRAHRLAPGGGPRGGPAAHGGVVPEPPRGPGSARPDVPRPSRGHGGAPVRGAGRSPLRRPPCSRGTRSRRRTTSGPPPRGPPSGPTDIRPFGSNYELVDSAVQFQPWLQHNRAELPHAPLWNPAIGAGRPYLANAQSAVLSPFSFPASCCPSGGRSA